MEYSPPTAQCCQHRVYSVERSDVCLALEMGGFITFQRGFTIIRIKIVYVAFIPTVWHWVELDFGYKRIWSVFDDKEFRQDEYVEMAKQYECWYPLPMAKHMLSPLHMQWYLVPCTNRSRESTTANPPPRDENTVQLSARIECWAILIHNPWFHLS